MMSIKTNESKSGPQTYLMKEFRPGEKGLDEAITAESTVMIQVIQGPIRRRPGIEYMVLEGGKKRIVDPITESNPYRNTDWDLYINLVEGWIEINGQSRTLWKNDGEHRVLEAMLTNYPHDIDRFDAGDANGAMKVTDGRFRSLITGVRKLVGDEILPDRYRALSKAANIIVERRG